MSKAIVCLFVCIVFSASVISAGPQDTEPKTRQGTSPAGRWKTVDDVTGKAKSMIAIWVENGKLYGRIEELIDPDPHEPDPRCNRCDGEMKGRLLVGLRILWDLRQDGEGEQWSGGKILDPENGKTYKCSITVEDSGRKLKVRGFIGFSILGRTQYWLREE